MRINLSILFILLIPFCIRAQDNNTDSTKKVSISKIILIGNRVTKERIILRELTFKLNDSLTLIELAEVEKKSRQNLLNTSLFNFVTFNHLYKNNNTIELYITLTERWYIWPTPIFELADRNFNVWWQKRDFTRVNYGTYVSWNNFRGRKEILQLTVRLGYAERYGIYYSIPNLGKTQRNGISFTYNYSQNREIGYASKNDVLQFFKDEKNHSRHEQNARFRYSYRKVIYNTHIAEFRYNAASVSDSILKLTQNYFIGNKSSTEFFSIYYGFVSDHRDNQAYPLHGYYFAAEFTQIGLGVLKAETNNFLRTELSFRKHIELTKRWYFAASLKVKLSTTYQQPYYVQRGLGYTDYIRGYEYYVIDGQQYTCFRSNLKYELVKPHTIDLNTFVSDKFDKFHYAFYLNAFYDAGYVKDKLYYKENPYSNQYIYGTGIGLDFVTYYDAVLRMEVAINKQGQTGFFLHYFAPI